MHGRKVQSLEALKYSGRSFFGAVRKTQRQQQHVGFAASVLNVLSNTADKFGTYPHVGIDLDDPRVNGRFDPRRQTGLLSCARIGHCSDGKWQVLDGGNDLGCAVCRSIIDDDNLVGCVGTHGQIGQ